MSIDLDWTKLDASLASSLIGALNRQLQSAPRPSFIGPVEITSFDFGSQPPDIELVDLRDIYRDFLEDNDGHIDPAHDPGRAPHDDDEDDDEFEWVSRRSAGRGMAEEAPTYHHLPPHVRYGRGPASDMFAPSPSRGPAGSVWSAGMSLPALPARPAYYEHPLRSLSGTPLRRDASFDSARPTGVPSSDPSSPHPGFAEATDPPSPSPPPPDEHPHLQLHLHVSWHSDLRLTLTTSLRINYPSPLFMSLPIRLSVTGLVFAGELAVAYEGGRRVHLCVLDELDPYGPAARRSAGTPGSTPSDGDGDDAPAGKALPVGQRLLPDIFIESELGQADKHVLKNVTRVEKFIQDVIRKTVEEELVFPNFHTLVLR